MKNSTLAERLESDLNVTFPKRLKAFYESKEYKKYDGLYVYNLYGYKAVDRFKVRFFTEHLKAILSEHDIIMPEASGAYYIPFVKLEKESQFLGIDITKGEACPVFIWEHEDGKFHHHADSLDAFLSKLLKKGEEVPLKRALKMFGKARELYTKGKYKEAVNLLDKVMDGLASDIPRTFEEKKEMGELFNLRGICKMKINEIDGAIEDYSTAFNCNYIYSGLNIISCYLQDKKEYSKALEFAAKMDAEYLDVYCRFHVSKYKGIAYIYLENANEANIIYRDILEKYAASNPDYLEKCIKDLKDIETKGQAGAGISAAILKWFGSN